MKMNLLILAFIIAATGAWTYLSDSSSNRQDVTQAKIANFQFVTLDNKTKNLYDYKGKVILLHFWATWCAPCIEELPKLMELATRYPDDVTVLAVAVADKENQIHRFFTRMKKNRPANFIVAMDVDKNISQNTFGTIKLPETYVISPKLTLAEKIIGAENDWSAYSLPK